MKLSMRVACAFVALGPALSSAQAQTATPSAIVETVSGAVAGVQFLDYLAAGRTIALGADGRLTLGYFRSCQRETISGGTVTIGEEQSAVAGGRVDRQRVECDGGRLRLNSAQARKSGVVVFRTAQPRSSEPQLTLFGTSPVFDVASPSKLVVERLDQPGERLEFDLSSGQLQHGAFFDFAKANRALVAGGLYRATAGASPDIVFKVAPQAAAGASPIVGRILKF